jgi:mitochondrial fission protein ELM1
MSRCLNLISGRQVCRGCLWCLRRLLEPGAYSQLTRHRYDIIISCGSSLAAVNYILSRDNDARSLAVMRPSLAAMDRYDLIVMSGHDRPPRRRNVVRVAGALNLVDGEYLREQASSLALAAGLTGTAERFGFLIGGDTKDFRLTAEAVREACRQLKKAAGESGAELLVTTSRRTSAEAEKAVKDELSGFPRCRLAVIANEANVPFAVGGILGSCSAVVCTPESVSMISEAATSPCHVLALEMRGLGRRHRNFLDELSGKGAIRLVRPDRLAQEIGKISGGKAARAPLADIETVKEALRKVLR